MYKYFYLVLVEQQCMFYWSLWMYVYTFVRTLCHVNNYGTLECVWNKIILGIDNQCFFLILKCYKLFTCYFCIIALIYPLSHTSHVVPSLDKVSQVYNVRFILKQIVLISEKKSSLCFWNNQGFLFSLFKSLQQVSRITLQADYSQKCF